jgi:3-hydroxybutyryl-CoA dehydrogenase
MKNDGRVAILGAGTMGRQIGLQLAAHGVDVRIYDPSPDALQQAVEYMRESLPGLVNEGHLPEAGAVDRVSTTDDLAEAVREVWLVIEAAPERMDLKRELYTRLSELASEETVLATNSSSFRSGLLTNVTHRPERLMNMHFLNHPWQRPAVELMTSGHTDTALLEKAAVFLRRCGLYPVIVQGESTGFLFNRIWRAIKKESLKVAAAGHGTPEDIDRFWCISTGLKMGPFALMDRVGLDVVLDIERHYAAESGDPDDEPPEFLARMVDAGRLGVKSGRGFYEYPHPPFEHPDWPYDR